MTSFKQQQERIRPLKQTMIDALGERLWFHSQKAAQESVCAADGQWFGVNLDACIDHLEQALQVARTLKKEGESWKTHRD